LCNSELVRDRLAKAARGTTRSRITRTELGETEIPLPPLCDQRKIAGRLDHADRLRRTRRYALELTDTFLPAAFLELFGDPEKNPLGWSESELGELCEEVLDCPHTTPIYTAVQTRHPCVRSSDIQNGYLDFSEAKYVGPGEYQKRTARGKPMPGDVIYCREGARFGNAGRVIDKSEVCLGQRTMLFRANPKVAVGEFIWAFLSSRGAYRQAIRALDGSASPHVNVGEIVAFGVPVPPLSVQQKFASMCTRVDQLRAVQREALRQAEHLFASLLHSAFCG
jgi:type I restriction enzyme, S subunit